MDTSTVVISCHEEALPFLLTQIWLECPVWWPLTRLGRGVFNKFLNDICIQEETEGSEVAKILGFANQVVKLDGVVANVTKLGELAADIISFTKNASLVGFLINQPCGFVLTLSTSNDSKKGAPHSALTSQEPIRFTLF